MRTLITRFGPAVAALLAGLTLLGLAPAADKEDEGFMPLFNGKDFTGWKMVLVDSAKDADPAKTFKVKDGVIVVIGKPNGYFYTDKSYKNYVLRFEWRYERPADLKDDKTFKGNSGCLVHIQSPYIVWPKSVEVQGLNLDHGHILGIGPKGNRATFKGNLDKKTQQEAINPVGQWNTTEIICKDGEITSKINGKQVDSGKGDLVEGQIGFQSEGAEIHFRNVKIKEMK